MAKENSAGSVGESQQEGQQTGLSFSSADIKGMESSGNSLIITLKDGGTYTIENFRDLADNNVQLTMQDGKTLDTHALFQSLSGDALPVIIGQPAAGAKSEYTIESGQKYKFNFAPGTNETVNQTDGSLILTFEDGGVLVLKNFAEAMDSDSPAEVSYDGEFMSLREFLDTLKLADAVIDAMEKEEKKEEITDSDIRKESPEELAMSELAEQLAEVEPAAGEGSGSSGNSGYGFQSRFAYTPIVPLDDVGPIDPTALQFTLPEFNDDLFFEPQFAAAPTPPAPPVLEVSDAQVYEDGSVTLNIFADPNSGPSVGVKITVTGIPAGWGVTPNGGVYNSSTGTWTIMVPPGTAFSGGPTLWPPANSDADIPSLTVTATSRSFITGLESTPSVDHISVTTDAVADEPAVQGNDSTVNEDTPAPVNVSAAVTDLDGSEHITAVYIKNVPEGFTLSAGTNMGGGVWLLNTGNLPGLTISAPTNFYGSVELEVVGVTTEDNKSGSDFDLTNDTADANDFFTVTWEPVADTPSIEVNLGADQVKVKEDGTVDVDIKAALNPADSPAAVLTVTVTGINPAWGFSAPIGTYNSGAGTWTVTLAPGTNLATVMTFTPPANSDIDLSGLVATATAFEPATETSASATDNFFITVDAVADAPTLDAANDSVNEGSPIPVSLSAALTDLDGSEIITGYQISGVPAGFTFSAGTDAGGGVWTFTPAQIAGLTLTPNNPDFHGTLNLTAKVLNTENPVSDGEYDTEDNNNEATDAFTLTWKPVADTPEILVNNGVDNAQVKEDGSVNVPIVANLNAADSPSAVLTVTVTGINPAWGFSAPVGVYNAGTGTWTVTLPAGTNLSTVMTFTPPANSDIDLSGLIATATAFEPATATSASATDGFGIIVDAVADAPTLDAQNAGGLELATIPLTINTALTDLDGSEIIKVIRISNVPAGFTLTAGTEVSPGVWELQPAQLAGLGINVPNGSEGNYTLNVQSISTEDPVTDGEYDPTDNDASAFDTITLCIEDNARPELGGSQQTVDETFLTPIVQHGSVAASFGTDGPGIVAGNGSFSAGGSLLGGGLKHNGTPIVVTYSAATGTYTGMAGSTKVFTLEINSAGTYTFQQFENLDHGNPNDPNDVIQLNFGVKATDIDGDVATNTITISVLDDAPVANNDNNEFSLIDGGTNGNVISGTNGGPGANDDVGEDNPAKVTSVTFNGTTYTVPANSSVTINGENGKLVMHSNGQYTYTLNPCPPANSPPKAVDDCYTVFELDASRWNGVVGSNVLTYGNAKKYLDNGATVHQDTGSDGKGFWYKLPVLKNDSDPDGDALTITNVVHHSGSMTGKEFKLSADGKFILIRVGQDGNTSDSNFQLKYTISDGKGGKDTAIVTVKIKDHNSPLVMDLDGDGIELLPIEAGVKFDMGPNGELDHTGWAGAHDGLLAIDLNSDGAINNHGELFGTGTTDGFTVLSAYDSNSDNVINASDTAFGNLIVWRDANSDGVSQAGEMHSLTSLGITSINVAASNVDYMLEGSLITHQSTFVMNGNTHTVVDAWFETMAVDVPAGPSVPPTGGALVVDQFTYTLTDTDGDSDQALLTLTAEIPPPPQITLSVNGDVPNVHVKEDGSVSVAVDLTVTGGTSTMSTFLVISGINPSWGFTPPAGWTATAIPGNYSITLAPGATSYNGSFTFTPPANSDIDLTNLRVTANTASYGSGTALLDCGCGGTTTSYTDTETDKFNIIVDAVADKPTINVGNVTGEQNTQVSVNISAALTDLDGSELISGYQITGVPAGFTFSAGTNAGGGVWNFTPAQIVGLKIKAPAGYEGTVNLTATVFNTENPVSDGEFDPSDNNNQASDPFSFTVVCDNQPTVVSATELLDETALSGGALTETGTISPNYFTDGPGIAAGTGTFSSSGSRLGGALKSHGVAVAVTYDTASATYTGKAGTTTVFTLKMNANGTYEFKLFEQLDHADGTNANDAINLVFGVKATDADGDIATGTVTITVKDDAPDAVNEDRGVAENQTVTGNVTSNDNVGQDAPGTVTKVTFGSTAYTVPATGNLIINATNGTLTINATGAYSYTAKNNANGYDAFTYTLRDYDGDTDTATLGFETTCIDDEPVIVAATNTVDETGGFDTVTGTVSVNFGADAPGTIAGTGSFSSNGSQLGGALKSNGVAVAVTYNATTGTYTGKAGTLTVFTLKVNANGTYEFKQLDQLDHANAADPNDTINLVFGVKATDSDNDTSTNTITIAVKDDAPDAVNDGKTLAENQTVTGNVTTNDIVGADAPGTVTKVLFNTITYTVPATGNLVISTVNGTLTINAAGAYSYTAKNNAAGTDNFVYTLRDYDGDTDTACLSIVTTCVDDTPVVVSATNIVDETGGFDTVSGTVSVNYGADGAGGVLGSGSFSSNGSQLGGSLKSHGVAVAVTYDAATGLYTGKAGTTTVFTLKINTNGTYEFKQLDQLDHADGTNADDIINLVFGVQASDLDEDTGTGTITIQVKDDAPDAVNDGKAAAGAQTITGNVTTNDIVGADAPGTVTRIVFGSTTYNVPAAGDLVIAATYGTLTINSTGAYSYTAKNTTSGTDNFTYTLRDYDGDTDTACLSVVVTCDIDYNPVVVSAINNVDETGGFDTVSGTVSVNFGGDGPGTITGSNAFSSSVALKSNGVAVAVTYNATTNTYTGKAGTATVFTAVLNPNGSYTFKQFAKLDHPDKTNANDIINLVFGVKATDSDGDVGTGTLTIRVYDDGPKANNDVVSFESRRKTFYNDVAGNLTTNDTYGQDGAGRVTQVKFGTQIVDIPAGGSVSILIREADFTDVYGSADRSWGFAEVTIRSNGTYQINRGWGYDGGESYTHQTNRSDATHIWGYQGDWQNIPIRYVIQDDDGDTSEACFTLKITLTPLVLDLDRDGIELVAVEEGVLFDMGADGNLDQTAWAAADDALLAIDKNNDGTINDQSELFGMALDDGFAILSQYDSNKDGVIDAKDAEFGNLIVWQDANSDGVSQAGEMTSLADRGVASISLDAYNTDYNVAGNNVGLESVITYTDGSKGVIADAWFNTNTLNNVRGTDGDDTLAGTEGADVLLGGAGNDTLSTGAGSDFVYGDAGADTFLFQAIADGVDTIKDFDAEEGDTLDLSLLLQTSYDPLQHDINEFVFATEVDGSTVISVDTDGAGDAAAQQNLAVLDGVTGVDIQDLLDNGNLLT